MFDFGEFHLCDDAGDEDDPGIRGLCVMQAVAWFADEEKLVDAPKCACPVLRGWAISLNDSAPSQEHRDSLWSIVFDLLDSKDPNSVDMRENIRKQAYTDNPNWSNEDASNYEKSWCGMRQALIEAIHMGKHGEPDPAKHTPKYLRLKEILCTTS